MKMIYFPGTDSLIVNFGVSEEQQVGEVTNHTVGDDLVFQVDEVGTLLSAEIMAHASERMNLDELTVEVAEPDGLTSASYSAPLLSSPETREERFYRGPGTMTVAEARIYERELRRRQEQGLDWSPGPGG